MRLLQLMVVATVLGISSGACTAAERREAGDAAETSAAAAEARLEDGAVTAAVKTKLLADPTVSGMRIDVDTRDGVVTLTGTVTTEAARARANELARTTDGALRVDDRLTVAD